MTRIDAKFADLKAQGKKAFVSYIMAGDPDMETSLEIMRGLPAAGVDVIELGMPFTDPMADGPSIQLANLRSLGAGTKTADLLDICRAFRERHPNIPMVLMGYANPMVRRGAEWFAKACKDAGVDGVICVDIPTEEDDSLGATLREHGIGNIRLATPTTDAARLPTVLSTATGFLYYVSVAGVTGKQDRKSTRLNSSH